ncbi:MAG: single-stranded DNA-binding protein [Planctomycetota bacterium]|nr:single-stranded DNA-binding protein [Planctomycetota bacterium]
MAGFNKVLLMGNLTRDPQLSYTPNQTAVVDFGLAVNRRWTSKGGEAKEETCFVDCRAFGRQAENINKYLTKGRAIFLEGRLTFDSWTAQDGTKRSRHRVTVENFQFLPGAPTGDAQWRAGAPPGASESGKDVVADQSARRADDGTSWQAGPDAEAEPPQLLGEDKSGGGNDDIPF